MATLYCFWGQRLLLGAGLLVGTAFGAAAQVVPDTTRLHYGEELSPPAAPLPLRVQEEQRSLWKLGLNNFLRYNNAFGEGTHYTRYGLHLAYERRLHHPAWSMLGEVSPAIAFYRPDSAAATRRRLSVRAQVAGRYYYNRERRLLQGKNSGSFSANYISVALGAGLGREAHETPNFLYRNDNRQFVTAEVALLYGLQRRLGRRGFVDANAGVAMLLLAGQPLLTLGSSLRVGLALGPQPAPYARRLAPASEVATLRPRFYVGAEIGGTFYRVGYSRQTPYPASFVKNTPPDFQTTTYPTSYSDGYGVYAQYLSAGPLPYLYAGYYLRPRLAVQLGFQYGESFNLPRANTVFDTPTAIFFVRNHTLEERALAVPVLLRYALTPSFLRRVQFDAVGGLVPVWASATFREYTIVNHQATSEEAFGFQRRAFGLHAALGVDASYAFGRRRRVQAVTELLLNKDVRTIFQKGRDGFKTDDAYVNSGSSLAGGLTFGLRYRFGYR